MLTEKINELRYKFQYGLIPDIRILEELTDLLGEKEAQYLIGQWETLRSGESHEI